MQNHLQKLIEFEKYFYKNLGFDENIWDFTKILTQGFPELK